MIFLGLSAALWACVPAIPSETIDSPSTAVADLTGELVENDQFVEARIRMVETQIQYRDLQNPMVLEAMKNVPRHRFVDEIYVNRAYGDHPLPIGYGQTISQPYIVALMTKALGLEMGDRVLEIGTGSGYQAAILSEMGMEVYTIEIIPELAERSGELLQELGYENINLLNGDGYFGWEDFAPFNAIIVTAAPDHLPQPLPAQLAEGGRMVIPIGPPGAVQSLWLFEKVQGEFMASNLGPVTFVPFTRSSESP